jgi:hypothetical protein
MEKEYDRRMEEMNERIANRLCLFEESQVANAKKKAADKVNTILVEAGLQIDDFE